MSVLSTSFYFAWKEDPDKSFAAKTAPGQKWRFRNFKFSIWLKKIFWKRILLIINKKNYYFKLSSQIELDNNTFGSTAMNRQITESKHTPPPINTTIPLFLFLCHSHSFTFQSLSYLRTINLVRESRRERTCVCVCVTDHCSLCLSALNLNVSNLSFTSSALHFQLHHSLISLFRWNSVPSTLISMATLL